MLWSLMCVSASVLAAPDIIQKNLVAIESATVYDEGPAKQILELRLPVHRYRERRELTPLRSVSKFALEELPGDAPWLLYVEKFQDGGRLKINGVLIAELPATDADTTVRQLRPLRFEIPVGLLQVGVNVLEREWAVHENLLLIPRMWIGERKAVNVLFFSRDIAYRVLPRTTFVVAAVLALIMFSIYARSPDLKAYLWVAWSGVGFCVVDLSFLLTAIPSNLFAYWQLAFYSACSALTLGSYFFLLHTAEVDAPKYRRWALLISGFHCIAYMGHYLCTGNTYAPLFTRTSAILSAFFAFYPLAMLGRSVSNRFEWRKAIFLLISIGGILISLLDVATINGSRSAIQSGSLLQVFALVWFLAICAFLISDFSKSLAAQRALASSMKEELSLQKQELTRLHALERASQEAKAATLERGRIMQDMHDGLGSQLVSSLAMARAGELSSLQTYDLLRSCIDDLRLAIDTSQDTEDSLLLALGNLRFRMQPRLKAAGITLHWRTQTLSNPLPLRPQHQLPVLRVIQESLTNALKHSNASTITVEATNTDTELTIRIEDDGQGFDVYSAKEKATGKGLSGLEKRARVLGAQMQVHSSPAGTQVELVLPIERRKSPRVLDGAEGQARWIVG